jgi:hypothetical protein
MSLGSIGFQTVTSAGGLLVQAATGRKSLYFSPPTSGTVFLSNFPSVAVGSGFCVNTNGSGLLLTDDRFGLLTESQFFATASGSPTQIGIIEGRQ